MRIGSGRSKNGVIIILVSLVFLGDWH